MHKNHMIGKKVYQANANKNKTRTIMSLDEGIIQTQVVKVYLCLVSLIRLQS